MRINGVVATAHPGHESRNVDDALRQAGPLTATRVYGSHCLCFNQFWKEC